MIRASRPPAEGSRSRPAAVRAPLLLLCCVGLLLGVTLGDAGTNVVAGFEAANRLYEEGRFEDAAEAYAALLQEGRVSANLCFNLGNAWFKAGQLGQAIVNYRRAARLAPRDPDVEANLRMARELVSGSPPAAPALWRRLVRPLTLNEWAGLVAICLWVAFGLLTAQQWRRPGPSPWPRWIAVALSGLALSGLGLLGAWLDHGRATDVVVTVPEAVVRYGPLDVSPQLVVVPDGTELTVLDRKDDWLQVGGLQRGNGWLRAADVTVVPR